MYRMTRQRQETRPPVRDEHRIQRFRVIYQDNYARILGYALRRCASPEDAADVLSQTFMTVWRRLDDVPPGEEARLWLYGVAHRALANHHRGERRRGALMERLGAEIGEASTQWFDPPSQDLTVVASAWRRLRDADQDLLGMVAWEGLANEQVARVLGCSRSVVKVRLHRARRRFARELIALGIDLKPHESSGHVVTGRAPARPGTEEA
jgi:RNA polymerase sigma factor (sigma-70 family)